MLYHHYFSTLLLRMTLEGFSKPGWLELNSTRQFIVYAHIVNISSRSLQTIRKIAEALIFASKENGLEVNAAKTKYMVMSPDQNSGPSHNMD
jgi:hypothetical protein